MLLLRALLRCYFRLTYLFWLSVFRSICVGVYPYSNSTSTFQLARLVACGDISPNPGPEKCTSCSRTIAINHRRLRCDSCTGQYHVKCGKVKTSKRNYSQWICQTCKDFSRYLLQSLPFYPGPEGEKCPTLNEPVCSFTNNDHGQHETWIDFDKVSGKHRKTLKSGISTQTVLPVLSCTK